MDNYNYNNLIDIKWGHTAGINIHGEVVATGENDHLQVGGFPELALADNDIMAQQIMREDVVDKVL